jgi:transglutaminase-like putative cysteine protease
VNRRVSVACALLVWGLAPTVLAESRALRFTYEAEVGPLTGSGPAHVFVPLAESDEHQRVLSREVTSSIPGSIEREVEHGNVFWHGELDEPHGRTIHVRVDYVVERIPYRREGLEGSGDRALSPAEARQFRRYLDADELVPVNHPVLQPALGDVRETAPVDDKARTARAIYDWLVDNVEYKKVGTGWGNGDAFWACSERYGNCTDFHSLFNALARTSGIPARFEIGFPIPEDRGKGDIPGYHCWAQFYLSEVGWVPVDASEAFKHPERREDFYGGQGADRIRFTTGRDIRLGAFQQSGPLNYFIYPHVEVGGQPWNGPMEKTFSFEDLSPDEVGDGIPDAADYREGWLTVEEYGD